MAGWVRTLLILFPLAVLALLIASYFAVRSGGLKPRNQMTLAGIGEAKVLNPILSTTSADSEVTNWIFEGLLRYNEDLEVAPALAESWVLGQTTTLVLADEAAASEAAGRLDAERGLWAGWKLKAAEAVGDEVRLRFEEPGTRLPEEVVDWLGIEPLPIHVIRVRLKSSAGESGRRFRQVAANGAQIRRLWIDTSTAYEITVSGDPAPIEADLEAYYSANPDLEATWERTGIFPRLDEPDILFELRRNVRWHDGEPFTVDDVEFTYRMIMDETVASPRRPDYELIQSVEVLGSHTVRVVYRKPYSPALLSWMMGILPKHILASRPTSWWAAHFNRAPVGTGPFRFAEWKSNEYIRLIRNEDYWGGRPHLDEVVLRTIPDPVAIRLSFETRQVDFWGVSQHAVGGFEKDPRFELFASPAPSYDYIGWNLRRPPFDDVRVRRALAHAVDVESIIRYILYGYGSQSTGIFPPQMWFANRTLRPIQHDPEKARALLAEAGWEPGPDGILVNNGRRFSFDLITNHGNEIRKDIATLVQADLKKIGIEVNVKLYEWAVFISEYVDKGEFDAVVLGWSLGYDYDQYQIWHSSQTGPGQLNFVGYKSQEADRLLGEIRTEFDTDRIEAIGSRLQEVIYDDQPYLFLYVPKSIGAMWKDSYRVLRPADGEWVDEPVRLTKAGFRFYQDWFYRPEYAPSLKP